MNGVATLLVTLMGLTRVRGGTLDHGSPRPGQRHEDDTSLRRGRAAGMRAHNAAGIKMVGQLGFFDSTLGDIRSRNTFVCQ